MLNELLSSVNKKIFGIPKEAKVRVIGYDYVKSTQGLVDDYLTPDEELERFTGELGRLVDLAYSGCFWTIPREDSDKGGSWGWPKGPVTIRDACRFERVFELPDIADEASEDNGEVA